jgi:hypothetical protein
MTDRFKIKFFVLLTIFLVSQCLITINARADMTSVLDSLAGGAGYNTAGAQSETALAETIGSIIAKFLEIIGIVFLIYMIYGGWIWMKAKGNEEQVTRARNILTNSIIGIVIIMGAYALTFFIMKSLGAAVGLTNLGFGS